MKHYHKTAAVPKKRRIHINDSVVEYSVIRSSRRKKTISITVFRGRLEVSAPPRATIKDIESILLMRGDWILDKLATATAEAQDINFVSGESLPYLGRRVQLSVEEDSVRRPSVELDGEKIVATVPAGLPPENAARASAVRLGVLVQDCCPRVPAGQRGSLAARNGKE